ncbi:histidine kinase [Streptomyces yaizuensis]|uniref:Histidine kinase n=1 Tax=Streptomyces yaizuensis TaxID=2989713 RepID=A0ABQ5NYI2_9ACTN|nr:histidine kinase [Streptomyces sp. YSPA8]GLF95432.1 histidine kinase [Streptomyces sp. YSPA8]
MPSYDIARSRLRLGGDHVFALTQLATGEPVAPELTGARDELRASGLIEESGALSVLLRPLIETLLNPVVMLSVETAGRQGQLHHGMVIGENHVYSHEFWPGATEAEYVPVEPKMLVWALAHMVNLRQEEVTADAAGAGVLDATVGVLDAGLAALDSLPAIGSAAGDREHIRTALRGAGAPDGPEQALFADLLAGLRSSWRITAAWQGHDDGSPALVSHGLAVWDCGPLGLWHRELPAEPVREGQVGPDSALRLRRVAPRRVWELITELLPSGDDIRRREAA